MSGGLVDATLVQQIQDAGLHGRAPRRTPAGERSAARTPPRTGLRRQRQSWREIAVDEMQRRDHAPTRM